MRLGTLFPLVSGCVLVNTLFDIFMSVFISTTPLDMLFSFLFPFLGLFRPLGGCSSPLLADVDFNCGGTIQHG